jgi:hypothetical protein
MTFSKPTVYSVLLQQPHQSNKDINLFQQHLLKNETVSSELSLYYCPRVCEFTSESPVLFHWVICLCLSQCHCFFSSTDLYSLMTNSISQPFLFFFFTIILIILHLLYFYINFRIRLSISPKIPAGILIGIVLYLLII